MLHPFLLFEEAIVDSSLSGSIIISPILSYKKANLEVAPKCRIPLSRKLDFYNEERPLSIFELIKHPIMLVLLLSTLYFFGQEFLCSLANTIQQYSTDKEIQSLISNSENAAPESNLPVQTHQEFLKVLNKINK